MAKPMEAKIVNKPISRAKDGVDIMGRSPTGDEHILNEWLGLVCDVW